MFKISIFCYLFAIFQIAAYSQPSELVIQSGHSAWIEDYASSPDHKYMATASMDNTIKLWDLRSKKEIRTFRGHKFTVNSVVFSQNSQLIASGDDNGQVNIWDLKTGKLIDTFNHKTKILSIAFSGDNSLLATNSNYKLFKIRDIKTRKFLLNIRMDFQGYRIAFMPGNNNLVTFIAADSTFNIWDIKGDSTLKYLKYSSGSVTDFVLSPDGRYVVSIVSTDSSIRIYNLKEWKAHKKLRCYNHYPTKLVYGNGDSIIFTSANFRQHDTDFVELKKWNLNTGQCLDSLISIVNFSYIPALLFSPLTKELILQYRHSLLATFNVDPLQFCEVLKKNGTLVNIIIKKTNGVFLLIGEDGPIKELNIATNTYRIIYPTMGRPFNQLNLLQDSLYAIARIGGDSQLYKLNLITFERQPFVKDSMSIRNFNLSVDGKRVSYYATKTVNGRYVNNSSLIIKDLIKDSVLYRKNFKTNLLYSYSLLGRIGELIALQDKYDTLSVTNISTNKSLELTDTVFRNNVATFCIMLDSDRLLVATNRGKFFIWDMCNGKLIKSIIAHTGDWVYNIVFSADSSQMMSFGDEVIKIWDTKTFNLKQSFTGHQSWVFNGGFLDGETKIYSSSADQTFRIWDVVSGKEIANFMMVDTANMVTRLPNKYYASSRQAMKHLSYRVNNELYPFEQFDLQYNRPHEILKAIGATDTALITSYQKAYYKRLKKSGFKESDFNEDTHLPETIILNEEQLPNTTSNETVFLHIKLTDKKYNLNRYFVSINNVPLNGLNGVSIKRLGSKIFLSIFPVRLATGKNKIQVSCMNDKGVESLRIDKYITFQPLIKPLPKLYFIGIGVSRYKDASHNLTFADKDTRDLVGIFKNKYPGAIIDTLLNEAATTTAILKIKSRLKKTSIEDIVIISVSSHGMLDKDKNYYIGTYDVDFNNPANKGLRYEDLENLLEDIPARKKLLLIDACHSGELDKEEKGTLTVKDQKALQGSRGVVLPNKANFSPYKSILETMNDLFADVTRTNGAFVISAAGGKEYALEDAKWENGVFTFCIKKALLEGRADAKADGVSISELSKYVGEQVYLLTAGRQRPTTRKENIEFDWNVW